MFDSLFGSQQDQSDELGITEHLVLEAQQGQEGAFNELFSRLTNRLLFFVKARMGSKLRSIYDPWDVLQETYLSAYQSLDQFSGRGVGSFTSWIFRVAENRLRSLHDRSQRKKRHSDKPNLQNSAVFQTIRDSHVGPVTECANGEAIEKLLEAIETLPDLEKEILFARYFRQEKLTEIGTALNRSESGVRAILARIHIKLGRILTTFQN
jgi:RNA polymerase sigma factor (sigma-70 family)